MTAIVTIGCTKSSSTAAPNQTKLQLDPLTFEAAAADLLAQRLTSAEATQGWVRLFDGHTLFGWEIASATNWRVEDQAIVVDAGEVGLLCTSVAWADYELTLEFKADANTNSGIFLRTPLAPSDPGHD